MKHKRSLEALIVGFVLTIAVSFFSTKIAGAVLAVSLIQMFALLPLPALRVRALQCLRQDAELLSQLRRGSIKRSLPHPREGSVSYA